MERWIVVRNSRPLGWGQPSPNHGRDLAQVAHELRKHVWRDGLRGRPTAVRQGAVRIDRRRPHSRLAASVLAALIAPAAAMRVDRTPRPRARQPPDRRNAHLHSFQPRRRGGWKAGNGFHVRGRSGRGGGR